MTPAAAKASSGEPAAAQPASGGAAKRPGSKPPGATDGAKGKVGRPRKDLAIDTTKLLDGFGDAEESDVNYGGEIKVTIRKFRDQVKDIEERRRKTDDSEEVERLILMQKQLTASKNIMEAGAEHGWEEC